MLGRMLALTALLLLVDLGLVFWFSTGQFVIGVIHGDRAIRQSEGNSGCFRSPRWLLGVQMPVKVASSIYSTE